MLAPVGRGHHNMTDNFWKGDLMQTTNRFLDDLAKVANGAVSTMSGIKGEIEAMIRQRMDSIVADMDLVSRDEFDAVKAMAAKARTEQEKLEKRLAGLEARLGVKDTPKTKKAASSAKPRKTAAKAPSKKAKNPKK